MDWTRILDYLDQSTWILLTTGILIGLIGLIAIKRLLVSPGALWGDDVPDTVMLYQFHRGPYAPSFSPYCLKLETYLRMADIPYKNVFGLKFSSKGKMPWIRYNGVSIADSQICMEFLNKKLDVDLNSRLDRSSRSVSRAFSALLEESLVWYLALDRWLYNKDKPWLAEAGVPWLIRWFTRSKVKKAAYYQGTGRHSREEIYERMSKDIEAVATFLGVKRFLMGFEPTEVDCVAFSMITQLTANMPGCEADTLIREKHPHLLDYCDRMRRRFWPDWEECITNGGKKKATK